MRECINDRYVAAEMGTSLLARIDAKIMEVEDASNDL